MLYLIPSNGIYTSNRTCVDIFCTGLMHFGRRRSAQLQVSDGFNFPAPGEMSVRTEGKEMTSRGDVVYIENQRLQYTPTHPHTHIYIYIYTYCMLYKGTQDMYKYTVYCTILYNSSKYWVVAVYYYFMYCSYV